MTKNATYGAIPTAEALPMVEVTAPANLQEGYKFTAVYEGVEFPVIVPEGGCTKGEVLTVPFKGGSAASRSGWKDDIFACTRYGIFHPSLILACCCRPVLLGQVMTRLKLDWKGNPGGEWKDTFRIMCYVFGAYCILNLLFTPTYVDGAGGVVEEQNPFMQFIAFLFFIFLVYVISKVRKAVRERDQIAEEQCVGCEDVACACCCACCTISQMARQTTDYDVTEGHYFTTDGLPPPPTPVITV